MYSNVVKERLLEESKEGPHTEIQLKKIVSTIPYTTKKGTVLVTKVTQSLAKFCLFSSFSNLRKHPTPSQEKNKSPLKHFLGKCVAQLNFRPLPWFCWPWP